MARSSGCTLEHINRPVKRAAIAGDKERVAGGSTKRKDVRRWIKLSKDRLIGATLNLEPYGYAVRLARWTDTNTEGCPTAR
jgi:hypothetical protein